jgi:arginine repressor
MKKFTNEERDPIFTKLIKDAEESGQPNILHHLKSNGFDLTL